MSVSATSYLGCGFMIGFGEVTKFLSLITGNPEMFDAIRGEDMDDRIDETEFSDLVLMKNRADGKLHIITDGYNGEYAFIGQIIGKVDEYGSISGTDTSVLTVPDTVVEDTIALLRAKFGVIPDYHMESVKLHFFVHYH